MALKIIVSYDDTDNDRDALALGRLLAYSGAELSLAYVRHSQGGALEEKEAEELLARGAASVGAPDMPRHVVVNAGTSVGLAELAERENADVIVFGSEYRTAPGTVKPGIPAHKLLLGGPAAIAVAPAGLRSHPSVSVNTIGVIDEGDESARETANSLAAALGASVGEHGGGPVDLLVVGSRPESPQGKVTLSAASDYAVEAATYPVLVTPRGVALSFAAASGSRPPDDEDHGRDLRVAAVDPLPRLAPVDRPAVVPGDHLRRDGLRRVGLDHEGVGHAAARGASARTLAGDVLRRALGVRPALAEGEVRRLHLRALEDLQAALARLPLPVAHLDRAGVQPRLDDLREQVLAGEVEDPGVVEAGADLDVEGHRREPSCFAMMRPMEPRLPDAVVFDNDGLLLDTESVWTRAEQDLFERRGLEFTAARQARAGRHLGRDRRRRPGAAARRSPAAPRS